MRRILLIVALVVLIICAVFWGFVLWQGVSYQDQIEARLAEIRARGEPVTLDDLTPEPVPPEENAATIYRRAYDVYVESGEETKRTIGIPWRERTPEQSAVVRDWVADNRQALALVRQASVMERCQFLDRYTGFSQGLPHLEQLNSFSFLLGESARAHLAEGEPQAAFDDCLTQLRLANHLGPGRCWTDVLVEQALIAIASASLQEVLAAPERRALYLNPLMECVERLRRDADFREAIIGERAMALHVIDHPEDWTEEEGADGGSAMVGSPLVKVWTRREKLAIIEGYEKLLAVAAKPWYESRAEREQLESWVEETATDKWSLPRLFVELLMPDTTGMLRAPPRREADLSQIALGAELEFHRRRTGSFPPALIDLRLAHLDELPVDPFTGRPLVYRRTRAGYTLYSLGPNGRDDGGKSDRDQGFDDIAWTVDLGSAGEVQ